MDKGKLLQVSMDGPDVIVSFLTSLNEKKMDGELSHLVSLGCFGLHTIHNSFKHGENATGWNLKRLLSSIFKIFHESPSKHADCNYPLQFCGCRWVQNENVAKRARNMLPNIVTVVKYWKGLAKSKQPGQGKPDNTTSYDHFC